MEFAFLGISFRGFKNIAQNRLDESGATLFGQLNLTDCLMQIRLDLEGLKILLAN